MINRSALFTLLFATVMATGTASAVTYMQDFNAFGDGTTNLGDGSAIHSNDGNASVQSGALQMTVDSQTSTRSSWRIPALVDSSLGWTAKFDFTMADAAGGNPPADGFSLSYGNIPAFPVGGVAGYGLAEEGFGSGDEVSFEFDTWRVGDTEHGFNVSHNQVDLAPVVNTDIIVDGGTVNGSAVLIWDPTNGLTMTVDLGSGPVTHFTNVSDGAFVGNDAYSWAFSARTGGATEDLTFDNVMITTNTPVPEPMTAAMGVLGLAALGLRRRRSVA